MLKTNLVVDPSIVDQGIDAVMLFDRLLHRRVATFGLGEFSDDQLTSRDLCVKPVSCFQVAIHNDGNRALGRKSSHDGGANAFRAAGDEYNLILELKVHVSDSAVQIHEAAINQIVGASNERRRIAA